MAALSSLVGLPEWRSLVTINDIAAAKKRTQKYFLMWINFRISQRRHEPQTCGIEPFWGSGFAARLGRQ
jgi:hypothetical protein